MRGSSPVTNAMINPIKTPSSANAPSRMKKPARGHTTAAATGGCCAAYELDAGIIGGGGGGTGFAASPILGSSGPGPTSGTGGISTALPPEPEKPALMAGAATTPLAAADDIGATAGVATGPE